MAWSDFNDPVYSAIRAYFTANWPHTPIKWPNETLDKQENSPYIVVEHQSIIYARQSIGAGVPAANRWGDDGLTWFHVVCPTGTGNENASGAADEIARLFRGITLMDGNLEFLDASKGVGGPGNEEGTEFVISVTVDWRHWDA